VAVPTYEKARALDLRDEPGTRFTYGGIPLQVFGAVLARKLEPSRQTPHDYLQRRILDPIGAHIAKWRTLADGSHPLPTGAFVAAGQWCKYGQYVSENYKEFAQAFVGSSVNPRYGLGFWLGIAGGPADLFYASGAGGQSMYVVPSQELVIVHFGNSRSFKHKAFLTRCFQ
jgi:CubicO group peptidase (beta-lactamase class C family)